MESRASGGARWRRARAVSRAPARARIIFRCLGRAKSCFAGAADLFTAITFTRRLASSPWSPRRPSAPRSSAPRSAASSLRPLSRRALFAAAAGLPALTQLPASALAAGGALSEDAVKQLISQIPLFAVTNKASQPYLTDASEDGIRTGFFFLDPKEALDELRNVRSAADRARALPPIPPREDVS